jgi:hypothetical protein
MVISVFIVCWVFKQQSDYQQLSEGDVDLALHNTANLSTMVTSTSSLASQLVIVDNFLSLFIVKDYIQRTFANTAIITCLRWNHYKASWLFVADVGPAQ